MGWGWAQSRPACAPLGPRMRFASGGNVRPARAGPPEGPNFPSEGRDLPYLAGGVVKNCDFATEVRQIGHVPGHATGIQPIRWSRARRADVPPEASKARRASDGGNAAKSAARSGSSCGWAGPGLQQRIWGVGARPIPRTGPAVRTGPKGYRGTTRRRPPPKSGWAARALYPGENPEGCPHSRSFVETAKGPPAAATSGNRLDRTVCLDTASGGRRVASVGRRSRPFRAPVGPAVRAVQTDDPPWNGGPARPPGTIRAGVGGRCWAEGRPRLRRRRRPPFERAVGGPGWFFNQKPRDTANWPTQSTYLAPPGSAGHTK